LTFMLDGGVQSIRPACLRKGYPRNSTRDVHVLRDKM